MEEGFLVATKSCAAVEAAERGSMHLRQWRATLRRCTPECGYTVGVVAEGRTTHVVVEREAAVVATEDQTVDVVGR